MAKKSKALTARSRETTEALYARYDQLNELWIQAEKLLTQAHVPEPVFFAYDEPWYREPTAQEEPVATFCLGLLKVKGKWRICHGSRPFKLTDQEPDWNLITECSASERVMAAEHLPALYERVIESAKEFVQTVDTAIADLRRSVSMMSSEDLQEAPAERAKVNGQGE